MPEQILDGTGEGYTAKVNEENRLLVNAVSVELRTHISSVHGQTYSMNTGALTLGAIDTWHWVLYFKNTSTTRNLHIDKFIYNWNGGSTNFNRPFLAHNLRPSAGVPTANHTAVIATQHNHLVANVAEMEIYKWDGVANGMTNNAGPTGSERIFSQGRSLVEWDGSILMRLNDFVGLQVQAPEIGIFSVELEVYFVEREIEL